MMLIKPKDVNWSQLFLIFSSCHIFSHIFRRSRDKINDNNDKSIRTIKEGKELTLSLFKLFQ